MRRLGSNSPRRPVPVPNLCCKQQQGAAGPLQQPGAVPPRGPHLPPQPPQHYPQHHHQQQQQPQQQQQAYGQPPAPGQWQWQQQQQQHQQEQCSVPSSTNPNSRTIKGQRWQRCSCISSRSWLQPSGTRFTATISCASPPREPEEAVARAVAAAAAGPASEEAEEEEEAEAEAEGEPGAAGSVAAAEGKEGMEEREREPALSATAAGAEEEDGPSAAAAAAAAESAPATAARGASTASAAVAPSVLGSGALVEAPPPTPPSEPPLLGPRCESGCCGSAAAPRGDALALPARRPAKLGELRAASEGCRCCCCCRAGCAAMRQRLTEPYEPSPSATKGRHCLWDQSSIRNLTASRSAGMPYAMRLFALPYENTSGAM
ncbi:hypothetical protein TSOC_007226 [Tetrabaena socialis]|uniref:Uncharacterized protein n=1 Tax=Tetrabaena socialis TaxID=47790 RepID=A0A2J8A1Q2_9CHLO|nr:hypothetical protein TSOC_007226 [Tetrabaena socialis]|eukprot:PNH06443.1 hypothetical protein TSOC_007226 [Tetrabaena socialis]